MNTVILSKLQDGFITLDETPSLLSAVYAEDWEAESITDTQREGAIQALSTAICSVPWGGDRLLGRNQPWPLPTTETNKFQYHTAASDSTTTLIHIPSLLVRDMLDIVGGSVINLSESSPDYLQAATILDYDLDELTLTIDSGEGSGTNYGLIESPASCPLMIVWPLHIQIRRALALQAYLILQKQDDPNLYNLAHKGKTSSKGEPGTTGSIIDVGGRVAWDYSAYQLIRPFLRNSSIASIRG